MMRVPKEEFDQLIEIFKETFIDKIFTAFIIFLQDKKIILVDVEKLRHLIEIAKTQRIFEHSRYVCVLRGEPYIKIKELLGEETEET